MCGCVYKCALADTCAALGNTLVPVITDTGRYRQAQTGIGWYCRLRHNILQRKGPAHPIHYYRHLTAVSTSTGLSVVHSHHHPQVPGPQYYRRCASTGGHAEWWRYHDMCRVLTICPCPCPCPTGGDPGLPVTMRLCGYEQ